MSPSLVKVCGHMLAPVKLGPLFSSSFVGSAICNADIFSIQRLIAVKAKGSLGPWSGYALCTYAQRKPDLSVPETQHEICLSTRSVQTRDTLSFFIYTTTSTDGYYLPAKRRRRKRKRRRVRI